MSNFADRLKTNYLKTLTIAEVQSLCPDCAEMMEASGITHLDLSHLVDENITGAVEDDPAKWKKFWKSLTGKSEHKFTKCMDKIGKKKGIKNPKALCGKLKSMFG